MHENGKYSFSLRNVMNIRLQKLVNFTMTKLADRIANILMFLSFGDGITIRAQNPQKKKKRIVVVPATALEKYGRF